MKLYPAIEFMRKREHQMVVGDRQNRLLLPFTPLAGGPSLTLGTVAVPAAVILGYLAMALVTLVLDTAQCRGMAVQQVTADLETMTIQSMPVGVTNKMAL